MEKVHSLEVGGRAKKTEPQVEATIISAQKQKLSGQKRKNSPKTKQIIKTLVDYAKQHGHYPQDKEFYTKMI